MNNSDNLKFSLLIIITILFTVVVIKWDALNPTPSVPTVVTTTTFVVTTPVPTTTILVIPTTALATGPTLVVPVTVNK